MQQQPYSTHRIRMSTSATLFNAAVVTCPKDLEAACRAGGAAQKGHFRVRHFDGFVDFQQQLTTTSTSTSAERVLQLRTRLVLRLPG